MREKLIKLLIKAGVTWHPCKLADYLIENGVIIPVTCENCAHSDYYDERLICYKHTDYRADEIRFLEVSPDGFCDDGEWRKNDE